MGYRDQGRRGQPMDGLGVVCACCFYGLLLCGYLNFFWVRASSCQFGVWRPLDIAWRVCCAFGQGTSSEGVWPRQFLDKILVLFDNNKGDDRVNSCVFDRVKGVLFLGDNEVSFLAFRAYANECRFASGGVFLGARRQIGLTLGYDFNGGANNFLRKDNEWRKFNYRKYLYGARGNYARNYLTWIFLANVGTYLGFDVYFFGFLVFVNEVLGGLY